MGTDLPLKPAIRPATHIKSAGISEREEAFYSGLSLYIIGDPSYNWRG